MEKESEMKELLVGLIAWVGEGRPVGTAGLAGKVGCFLRAGLGRPALGVVGLLGCAVPVGWGQDTVTYTERSEPAGIFAETASFVSDGAAVRTREAPETANSYRFGYWSVDGVALRDELGVALNPAQVTVSGATTAVAHYWGQSEDTDVDGIWDAWERRWYGGLQEAADGDTDGDGFSFETELVRGYHPKVVDTIAEGGLASRRSGQVEVVTDLSLAKLVQTSEPFGIVSEERLVSLGTVVSLVEPPASSSGYRFIGWYSGGTRLDSSSTWPPVEVTVDSAEVVVTARYVAEEEDADTDGIPDYYEWYYYDGLGTADEGTDTDGDGFSFVVELSRGYHPLYADTIEEGGIAARRSWLFEYNSGYWSYLFDSLPAGVFEESGLVADGSVLTSPDLWGDGRSGYQFGYWSVGGTPQRRANGVAMGQLSFTVDREIAATAHYFADGEDSDGDNVADWQEYLYYSGLGEATAATDSDGDGFTLVEELARGYHPLYFDLIEEGGLASRRSALFPILLNVVAWGANDSNQSEVPDVLAGLAIEAITSGEAHNVILTADGQLRAWGDNSEGQLEIPADATPAKKVISGWEHTLALREDGRVISWGRNLSIIRKLRVPRNLRNVRDIAVGRDHSLAVQEDGTVWAWGRNNAGQTDVPELPLPALTVAGGLAHSLALLEDGTVVAWGDNSRGQIAVPAGLSDVIMVACGQYHSLALKRDGTLVSWGGDEYGQTTLPARVVNAIPQPTTATDGLVKRSGSEDYVVSVAAGLDHSLAVFADGTVESWGRNDSGQTAVPSDLTDVRTVSAGERHSVALRLAGAAPASGDPTNERILTLVDDHGSILREPFQQRYSDGDTVQLTAEPDPGYTFTGWSGAVSGTDNPTSLTVDGDATVTASFARDPAARFGLAVLVEGDSGNTVAKSPAQVDYGWDDTVTLSAQPADGQRFVEWYGDRQSTENPLTVTMTGPVEIYAVFEADPAAADYAGWREEHFSATDRADPALESTVWGLLADPDGDGVSNLLEYAFGGDPWAAGAAPDEVHLQGSRLQIEFPRVRSDVTYQVMASDGLSGWGVIATNPGAVGQSVTVEDTVDVESSSSGSRFLRVEVTQP